MATQLAKDQFVAGTKWKRCAIIAKKYQANALVRAASVEITLVKAGKNKTIKITQREALIYLEKTHHIKMSISTYSKIIKGKY